MGWIDLDIEILSGEESIANGYFQAKGDTFCALYFTTQIVKFFFEMHNNMNMFQKAVLLLQMIGAGIDNEEAKLIFTQQFADPFGFSSIDKFTQQETFPPRISDKNELTINGEERLPILQYAGALFFPCLSKKNWMLSITETGKRRTRQIAATFVKIDLLREKIDFRAYNSLDKVSYTTMYEYGPDDGCVVDYNTLEQWDKTYALDSIPFREIEELHRLFLDNPEGFRLPNGSVALAYI